MNTTQESKLRIFEFQINGEKEWVAAKTLLIAIQQYLNITSMCLSEFDEKDNVVEIPESEWDKRTILDEDGNDFETFRQAIIRLNGRADIIATTLT